jgi:hypothetical protein
MWTLDAFIDPDGAVAAVERMFEDAAPLEQFSLDIDVQEAPAVSQALPKRPGNTPLPDYDMDPPTLGIEALLAANSRVKSEAVAEVLGDGADAPLVPDRAQDDMDEGWEGSGGARTRDDEIRGDRPPHW